MPDVHVICDAPIGCFNLVGTAVPDYTDAIPHIENLTPSVMREQEVGGSGTGPSVMRTYEGLRDTGVLEGKRLIVVSTAESEMIGSDLTDLVTQLQPGTTFYYSNSLSEDEWAGRDRVLRWLWEQYGEAAAAGIEPQHGTVNIIGPTYGCFNSPSDLEEVKRLIEGVGGRINLIYPIETTLEATPQLAAGQVNVVLYKEFGKGLAEALGQPYLFAPFGMTETIEFIRELATLLGTSEQAERFIVHEKRTTLKTVWDLWRGPQSDWFATTDVAIVAAQSYAEGLDRYLGGELGMKVAFVSARPRAQHHPDNEKVRQLLHQRAPSFVFGSINEKIYLSEAGARHTNFVMVAFPGPIVRRAVGTPYMGFRGAAYIIQEIVNRLYDTLFNFLPVDSAYAKPQTQGGPPATTSGGPGNLPWNADAKALLDQELEKVPFLSRISASRDLQMKVEGIARTKGIGEITEELVQTVLEGA